MRPVLIPAASTTLSRRRYATPEGQRPTKGIEPMNLELAVAESCGPRTCRVRSVADGAEIEAAYAAPVQDRIKVRSGDLVAVNHGTHPPEVVWRWWHGRVERVLGDRAAVSRNHTQPTPEPSRRRTDELPLAPGLAGQLRAGDTVFFGGSEPRVLDIARDGMPANPDLLRASFPAIVAAYQQPPSPSTGG